MSIYYKYAPDGTKIVVLSYFGYCVYWYRYDALLTWFVDTLRNIFPVNFMLFPHWSISNRISFMNDYSISVDHARYSNSIRYKYLDTATVNTSTKFSKSTFPSDMIFTKDDVSSSYEKFDMFTREFNIHYRACI